ncbi:MAG: hypothetical protein K9J27_10030 [Bacteroidales bacterium]|nr:hypothetical protein [Bacteroidales bacterium]
MNNFKALKERNQPSRKQGNLPVAIGFKHLAGVSGAEVGFGVVLFPAGWNLISPRWGFEDERGARFTWGYHPRLLIAPHCGF